MSGYSKIYVVGAEGGFQGSDGVNPIFYQILVGNAGYRWLEPHYFDTSIKPIGKISRVIPASSTEPEQDILLDSVLAFGPSFFEECPSLAVVRGKLQNAEVLDFDAAPEQVPVEWRTLRQEARELFHTTHIWQAELVPVKLT